MTNDLPSILRKYKERLDRGFGCSNFDVLQEAADEIDRLAREENALRGAYSAMLFERDALRSRLKLAEEVCEAVLEEAEKPDNQWELIESLALEWRSARDAKPKDAK